MKGLETDKMTRARKPSPKKRCRVRRAVLESWLNELNEWRWPFDQKQPYRTGDGRDHIRGAFVILKAVLDPAPPAAKGRRSK